METAIDMVANGELKLHQICNLLRKHIQKGHEISADALRNFKARALKHCIEETELDANAADKLLKFQPLEDMMELPNADLCGERARELMKQVSCKGRMEDGKQRTFSKL